MKDPALACKESLTLLQSTHAYADAMHILDSCYGESFVINSILRVVLKWFQKKTWIMA